MHREKGANTYSIKYKYNTNTYSYKFKKDMKGMRADLLRQKLSENVHPVHHQGFSRKEKAFAGIFQDKKC